MDCSKCLSNQVCKYIGDVKFVKEQVDCIEIRSLPFAVRMECKFYKPILSPSYNLLQQTKSSPAYCRDDIPKVSS